MLSLANPPHDVAHFMYPSLIGACIIMMPWGICIEKTAQMGLIISILWTLLEHMEQTLWLRYIFFLHKVLSHDTRYIFMPTKISNQGATYFVHCLEYGSIAAVSLTDGLKYYHMYDGDG